MDIKDTSDDSREASQVLFVGQDDGVDLLKTEGVDALNTTVGETEKTTRDYNTQELPDLSVIHDRNEDVCFSINICERGEDEVIYEPRISIDEGDAFDILPVEREETTSGINAEALSPDVSPGLSEGIREAYERESSDFDVVAGVKRKALCSETNEDQIPSRHNNFVSTKRQALEASNERFLSSSDDEKRGIFKVKMFSSPWPRGTICGFVWQRNCAGSQMVGVDAIADLHPISFQMTNIRDYGSCHFLVNQELRSDDVTWDVKALDRKTGNSSFQLFKREYCPKLGKYSELFECGASERLTADDNAEGALGKETLNYGLTLTVKRITYREAIIEWTTSSVPSVEKWLVVIRNEGRTPKLDTEPAGDAEWMILLTPSAYHSTYRIDRNLVSLEYKAGHKYSVTVFALRQQRTVEETTSYTIVTHSTASFRAEHTKDDLQKLLSKARGIREHVDKSPQKNRVCKWLYRDKTSEYFKRIEAEHDNVMEVYYKDANGDPASVIHGQLKGLFFSANVNFKDGEPMQPMFGNRRIKIPVCRLLSRDRKLYFADLYCINTTHIVTLVVVLPGSSADEFCSEKLIALSLTDEDDNPFLFLSSAAGACVSSRITVEVLYTENIDLKVLESEYQGQWENFYSWKNNRHGGKWKQESCATCNLYTAQITGAYRL